MEQFLKDHYIKINNLRIKYLNEKDSLDISNTAIRQLDLNLLYKLINKTKTPMGSRLLYTKLCTPMIHPDYITYDTKFVLDYTEEYFKNIKDILTDSPDIDKLIRGLSMSKLSISNFQCVVDYIRKCQYIITDDLLLSQLKKFIIFIDKHITKNDRLFTIGVYPEIDALYIQKQDSSDIISRYIKDISEIIKVPVENIKTKDSFGIITTAIRANLIKKKCNYLNYLRVAKINS